MSEEEMIAKAEKRVNIALYYMVAVIIAFIIGFCFGYINSKNTDTRPVEEIAKVDSLIKVNDSIKIKVEQLDSIKDAKIIEVQTLDNDSTVKLFYQLISE